MPSKVGDVIGLKAEFKGRSEATDVLFRVIAPTAQSKTFRYGENPEIIHSSQRPELFSLNYRPEVPGRYTYLTRATLDGQEVEAVGEFQIEGNPIKIEREVRVSEAREDSFGDDASDDMMEAYLSEVSESIPKDAPESDFANPPKGLYVGDALHARLAVQAVTGGFRGNKAKARSDPGVKGKIAAAVRKFYSGKEQKYYLTWLHTGKKPSAVGETIHEMISFSVPQIGVPQVDDDFVPLFDDIDLTALRERDPKPVFVTRPIAVLGGVSENDLVYDEYLLAEIERQVREKRSPARSGHVPEDAKSWMVPDTVGRWVGVRRAGNILYGKCYIYPGRPFHEDVQVSDAVGGQLSNSIYGDATLSVGEDGQMKCVGLALESIDFVPPERAALQVLGGEFEVTREMKGDKTMAEQDKTAMSDEQKRAVAEAYLRECDPAKMKEMLSEAQRRQVASDCVKEMGSQALYEMLSETDRNSLAETIMGKMTPENVAGKIQESHRQSLAESLAKGLGMKLTREDEEETTKTNVAEMKSMQKTLAEMQTTIARYEHDDFNRTLDAEIDGKFAHLVIKTDDGKKKIATLKANLRPQAIAEMAGSTKKEDIEGAVTRAYESPAFKPLAEMTIQSLSGPSSFVGVSTAPGQPGTKRNGYDPQTGRYDEEAVTRALQTTNLLPGRKG